MKEVNIAKIFDIDRYEKVAENKYKAVVIIGKYARYLIKESEKKKKPLGTEPVIVASEKFTEEGILYVEREED